MRKNKRTKSTGNAIKLNKNKAGSSGQRSGSNRPDTLEFKRGDSRNENILSGVIRVPKLPEVMLNQKMYFEC